DITSAPRLARCSRNRRGAEALKGGHALLSRSHPAVAHASSNAASKTRALPHSRSLGRDRSSARNRYRLWTQSALLQPEREAKHWYRTITEALGYGPRGGKAKHKPP